MIRIISVGKKHESWITQGLERYEKRLRAPWEVRWILLPHSSFEGDKARQEESERIEKQLGSEDFVILLDEVGVMISSPKLSSLLEEVFLHARQVVIVIGGAYGVSESLRTRADMVWSLSDLVFPHQLVRLLLVEQLYRAQEIAKGSGYHHS